MKGAIMVFCNQRAQTSFEAIMVAGVIIIIVAFVGNQYFGFIADQTTAVIILKTELLKQLNALPKEYVIFSSLEPVMSDGKLCFDVKTRPADLTAGSLDLATIQGLIAQKTKYDDADIKINEDSGC